MTRAEAMILDCIFRNFMVRGKDLSCADLAEKTGIPIGKVRKIMTGASRSIWDRVAMHQTTKPTYSRDYPGMETGRSGSVDLRAPLSARAS